MWNLSKRGRTFRAADTIFVSVPKCGRTWIRTFLHAYFSDRAKLDLSWDGELLASHGAPRLAFTHDRWEQRSSPELWRRIRGAELIPAARRGRGRVVLVVRDPRDVVVSLFFQITRRERWYTGDLASMLQHPRFGVDWIVGAMNGWLEEWHGMEGFLVLRYEDLRADEETCFRQLLAFLGFDEPGAGDTGAFQRSLEFAAFDNMKRLEGDGFFPQGGLRPGDPSDPESFKIRRGVIGGWRQYIRPEDEPILEEAMRRLDPRFGYSEC